MTGLPAAGPATAQTSEAQIIVPDSVLAETHPEVFALMDAIGLYDVLRIMSQEGIDSADDMQADMFPDQGGAAWTAVVAGIYSADRMIADFEAALPVEQFTPEVLEDLTLFFATEPGASAVAGEIAARRAFLEPGIEDTANEIIAQLRADEDPRVDLLAQFIAANDLVELNVSGALNSNFAFFQGLSDGGAFETDMPEELMLSEVWGQEPEIRQTTVDWLYAYHVVAYSDLTDGDLQAYIAMSETDAGRARIRALFTAFDVVFEQLSYDLGVAAAAFLVGEDA